MTGEPSGYLSSRAPLALRRWRGSLCGLDCLRVTVLSIRERSDETLIDPVWALKITAEPILYCNF